MDHDPDREAAGAVRALLAVAAGDGPPETDLLAKVRRRARRQRARRRARPVLVGGLAALVALALAGGLLPRGAGGPVPAAAAVLDEAASTAATRPPPELGPGQLWYTRTDARTVGEVSRDGPDGVERPREFLSAYSFSMEEWWGPTGVWRTRLRHGEPVAIDPDRAAWIAAGRPRLEAVPGSEMRGQQARRFINWPGLLFPDEAWDQHAWNHAAQRLQRLPTDPAALEQELRDNWFLDTTGVPEARVQEVLPWCDRPDQRVARRCPDEAKLDVAIFQTATWLLARPVTPPALRAALFRVLARLEGIGVLGTTTDEQGRRGTAVALTFEGVRHELLFDPGSSLLLAERDVIVAPLPLAPGLPVGTTLDSELHRTSVVDSVTATG